LEEVSDTSGSYYVLIVARRSVAAAGKDKTGTEGDWALTRKIWFDRKDLSIARIQAYDSEGKLSSDIRYSVWEAFGTAKYPSQIALSRPLNDYQLQIGITKLTLNEAITPDRFELKQPTGTELVQVGEDHQESHP
jgi:outer membrane lipoprotein-sorting protein